MKTMKDYKIEAHENIERDFDHILVDSASTHWTQSGFYTKTKFDLDYDNKQKEAMANGYVAPPEKQIFAKTKGRFNMKVHTPQDNFMKDM